MFCLVACPCAGPASAACFLVVCMPTVRDQRVESLVFRVLGSGFGV